jgi:hypothetical protein
MGNTWIFDLRHCLTPAGAFAEMPSPARRVAEYFASIVLALPDPEHEEAISWYCPVCGDNGLIRGWQGTLWDGFAHDHSRPVS